MPLRKTPRPPVIPDRVNPESREATVYLSNIYAGKGLEGVPPGTVKRLRLFEPHYAYPGMGGHISIGIDGPWDVHRILGTVPVEADGSASFKVPANTPIAVQPLDEKGRAVQIMRSWFTAMPGETVSCVGCHDSQNTTPGRRSPAAMVRKPSAITPWYGPARGFSFQREVQPVLDKYCVGCHDGSNAPRRRERGRRSGRGPTSAASRPNWPWASRATASRVPTWPCTPTSAAPARRAITSCKSRWSIMPARANWCNFWRRGITT